MSASTPAPEDPGSPPERPRLRRELQPEPARGPDGRPLLVLADPEGLTEGAVALALPVGLLALELLDGSRTRAEIAADWAQAAGAPPPPGAIDGLLAALSRARLLEGPAVDAARAEALARWRALPVRPAAHAGTCYPEGPAALRARLAAWRAAAGADPGGAVRALIAPHIDPRGGGPCHGAAAEALARAPAEVFVVLGTAHHALRRPVALTRHDFATPTGRLGTDRDLVDALARRGGGGLLDDERAHAGEHSIELQAAWLHALHGDRPGLRVVPVLVGGIHEHLMAGTSPRADPRWEDLVQALRDLRARLGDGVCFVASVDLAHVGPRYGDAAAPDPARLEEVLAADRTLLERAAALDPAGWLAELHAERDARNVCGAAPTWLLLEVLAGAPLTGRLLRHDRWEIDPGTGSHVSFAALAFVEPAPQEP